MFVAMFVFMFVVMFVFMFVIMCVIMCVVMFVVMCVVMFVVMCVVERERERTMEQQLLVILLQITGSLSFPKTVQKIQKIIEE